MNLKELIKRVKLNSGYDDFKIRGSLMYALKENNDFLNGISFDRVHTHLYVSSFVQTTFIKEDTIGTDFGKRLGNPKNDYGRIFKLDKPENWEISEKLITEILINIKKEKESQNLNTLLQTLLNTDRKRYGIHFLNTFICLTIRLKREDLTKMAFEEYKEYWENETQPRSWEVKIHNDIISLEKSYNEGHANLLFDQWKIENLKEWKLL